jgi:hypothetical protein
MGRKATILGFSATNMGRKATILGLKVTNMGIGNYFGLLFVPF